MRSKLRLGNLIGLITRIRHAKYILFEFTIPVFWGHNLKKQNLKKQNLKKLLNGLKVQREHSGL